jgi:hypothetical protein
VLGLQGAQLAQWIAPVRLSKVVVSNDQLADAISMHAALVRGIVQRSLAAASTGGLCRFLGAHSC